MGLHTHNMERINSDLMEGILSDIYGFRITEDMCREADNSVGIYEDFYHERSHEENVALNIADAVAQGIVSCPYTTVTFFVNL